MNPTPLPPRLRGFTLFEILIAIAVAAVLLGAGLYSTRGVVEEERLRGPIRALEALAQTARSRAVLGGVACAIRFGPGRADLHEIPPGSDPSEALAQPPADSLLIPADITLALQPWGAPEWIESPAFLWLFRPTGLSVPVRVRLTRGESWFEGVFNPLTADLEEERSHWVP